MSATVKRKLFGMLALGAALAFAGAGCVGAPGEADDEDEDIAAAVSELDAVDSDGAPDTADDGAGPSAPSGAPSAGDSAPSGMHPMVPVSGPDPLPWAPPGQDPEMDVGAPPMTRGMGSPSTGNGGK